MLGNAVSARLVLVEVAAPDRSCSTRSSPFPSTRSRAGSSAPASRARARARSRSLASRPSNRTSSRRFLPPDPRVAEPYRLTPQLALRVAILSTVVLVVFGVLVFRLWALQILSGSQYLNVAENNQLRTIRVQAPRGAILDRRPRPRAQRPGQLGADLAGRPPDGRPLRGAQAPLAPSLNVPVPEMAREIAKRKNDPLTPVTIKRGIHPDHVAYLAERQAEFPGVQVAQSYLRDYPFKTLAAQVLGYTGEASPEQLEANARAALRGRHRPERRGGRVRRVPARAAPAPPTARRLARTPALRTRARPRRPRLRDPAHDRRQAPARRRAGAALRDRAVRGGGHVFVAWLAVSCVSSTWLIPDRRFEKAGSKRMRALTCMLWLLLLSSMRIARVACRIELGAVDAALSDRPRLRRPGRISARRRLHRGVGFRACATQAHWRGCHRSRRAGRGVRGG